MTLPEPEAGLVIPYSYLWRDEQRKGRQEGRKDRPCVVILAVKTVAGRTRVTVVPITHAKPLREAGAIELPRRVKMSLGLDRERSWVVVEEGNEFYWPGFDLRTVPGKRGRYSYGSVPPLLYDRLVAGFLSEAARQRGAIVPRD